MSTKFTFSFLLITEEEGYIWESVCKRPICLCSAKVIMKAKHESGIETATVSVQISVLHRIDEFNSM